MLSAETLAAMRERAAAIRTRVEEFGWTMSDDEKDILDLHAYVAALEERIARLQKVAMAATGWFTVRGTALTEALAALQPGDLPT